jgi:hypothetical protein
VSCTRSSGVLGAFRQQSVIPSGASGSRSESDAESRDLVFIVCGGNVGVCDACHIQCRENARSLGFARDDRGGGGARTRLPTASSGLASWTSSWPIVFRPFGAGVWWVLSFARLSPAR